MYNYTNRYFVRVRHENQNDNDWPKGRGVSPMPSIDENVFTTMKMNAADYNKARIHHHVTSDLTDWDRKERRRISAEKREEKGIPTRHELRVIQQQTEQARLDAFNDIMQEWENEIALREAGEKT